MYHDINQILSLTKKYRAAIEKAYNNGDFDDDFSFAQFPRGCCGATCYVLAKYLKEKGIGSIYVCGVEYPQTHAWLVIKDDRIKEPSYIRAAVHDEIKIVLKGENGEIFDEVICAEENYKQKEKPKYQSTDLDCGIIVDITADQFDESPIFVGYIDDFHKKYEFDFAHESNYELTDVDLNRYSIIEKYL